MVVQAEKGRKFKVDFLENKASNEKFLSYIFDLFFRVESSPFRLYHQLPTTLYRYACNSTFSVLSLVLLLLVYCRVSSFLLIIRTGLWLLYIMTKQSGIRQTITMTMVKNQNVNDDNNVGKTFSISPSYRLRNKCKRYVREMGQNCKFYNCEVCNIVTYTCTNE